MDIMTASRLLSQLNIRTSLDNYQLNVKHFRVSNMSVADAVKRHMHSSCEFHIVPSGSCRVILDGSSFQIGAGEFYITAPGVYHEQIPADPGGYIEYSLNLDFVKTGQDDTDAGDIVRVLTETPCMPFLDTQSIIKTFEMALHDAFFMEIGFYENIKNLMRSILIRSARAMVQNLGEKNQPVSVSRNAKVSFNDNDFRILQIERFIGDNLSVPLKVEDIAQYMFLSKKQTGRIIMEKTGQGTRELIQNRKLDKAMELLENTDLSIRKISGMLGFDNDICFHRFFKTKRGITPGRYRALKQNQ